MAGGRWIRKVLDQSIYWILINFIYLIVPGHHCEAQIHTLLNINSTAWCIEVLSTTISISNASVVLKSTVLSHWNGPILSWFFQIRIPYEYIHISGSRKPALLSWCQKLSSFIMFIQNLCFLSLIEIRSI